MREFSQRRISKSNSLLCKNNIQIIKIFLTPEEFEAAIKEENANMENYPAMVYEEAPLQENKIKICLGKILKKQFK